MYFFYKKNMILQEFYFRILPSFELKLEILNIMPVCKFEINWSTNTNLRALTIYPDGRTDRRTPGISISPAPLGRRGTKSNCL